jgi:hypothetical protein
MILRKIIGRSSMYILYHIGEASPRHINRLSLFNKA